MKKILIPALLVVSAAFAPSLRNAAEFPDRVCEVAQEVAGPLFWDVWDELLTRELARLTQTSTSDREESAWQVALRDDAVVCLFFHVLFKHAFDGSLSVAKENNTFFVSIPRDFIRRTTERQFSRVVQLPAI